MSPPEFPARAWRLASWVLLAIWLSCALMVMRGMHGGVLTSYGADLTQPAWLYIVARSLDNPRRHGLLRRTIGSSPGVAALTLFAASTLAEISQYFWPHGLFRGTFDPLDIVAYGVGLAVCYVCDRSSQAPAIANVDRAVSREPDAR